MSSHQNNNRRPLHSENERVGWAPNHPQLVVPSYRWRQIVNQHGPSTDGDGGSGNSNSLPTINSNVTANMARSDASECCDGSGQAGNGCYRENGTRINNPQSSSSGRQNRVSAAPNNAARGDSNMTTSHNGGNINNTSNIMTTANLANYNEESANATIIRCLFPCNQTEEWKTQFYKTKLCPYHGEGRCINGATCRFAHDSVEMRPLPNLRRTKLCESYVRKEPCRNSSCPFAHDPSELRTSNHTFYKVALCNFYRKNRCWNGHHCRFAHGLAELQSPYGTPSAVVGNGGPVAATGAAPQCESPSAAKAQPLDVAFASNSIEENPRQSSHENEAARISYVDGRNIMHHYSQICGNVENNAGDSQQLRLCLTPPDLVDGKLAYASCFPMRDCAFQQQADIQSNFHRHENRPDSRVATNKPQRFYSATPDDPHQQSPQVPHRQVVVTHNEAVRRHVPQRQDQDNAGCSPALQRQNEVPKVADVEALKQVRRPHDVNLSLLKYPPSPFSPFRSCVAVRLHTGIPPTSTTPQIQAPPLH